MSLTGRMTTTTQTSSVLTPLQQLSTNVYSDTMATPQVAKWKKVTDIKINNLHQNKTWKLIPQPSNKRVIPPKLIYKNIFFTNRILSKHKCWFVFQGFWQKHGVEYTEMYAPTVHCENLCLVLALAVAFDLEIHAMDVIAVFLHSPIEEEIYIEQPEGYVNPDHPDWVCGLLKSLYGLKQAPFKWNKSINVQLCVCGFIPVDADLCIFVLNLGSGLITIIAIHVDDCTIAVH